MTKTYRIEITTGNTRNRNKVTVHRSDRAALVVAFGASKKAVAEAAALWSADLDAAGYTKES